MFKTILTSKKFLLGLGLLAIFTFIFSIITPKIKTPILLSSDPADNSIKFSVVSPLGLNFDIPIISTDFTVSSTPKLEWEVQQKDNNALIVSHKSTLSASTQYSLNIEWKNKFLTNINFKTEATQTDYELIKKITNEVERDYPLALFTPYETSQYRVVYSAPTTLEITLKNPNLTSEEAINDIKSWVTKNGGDANAHKYIISSGNMSPSPKPSTGALSTSPLR